MCIRDRAGGCFWGVEELFRNLPGVLSTEVGYTGGKTANPTYQDVKKGDTGHAEAIRVTFDPNTLTCQALLHFFFSIHDPTSSNRQGNDKGSQYRSAIFVNDDQEKALAKTVIEQVEKENFWKKPIVTSLETAQKFYSAEEEHQKYLEKNPGGYTCHWQRYPTTT